MILCSFGQSRYSVKCTMTTSCYFAGPRAGILCGGSDVWAAPPPEARPRPATLADFGQSEALAFLYYADSSDPKKAPQTAQVQSSCLQGDVWLDSGAEPALLEGCPKGTPVRFTAGDSTAWYANVFPDASAGRIEVWPEHLRAVFPNEGPARWQLQYLQTRPSPFLPSSGGSGGGGSLPTLSAPSVNYVTYFDLLGSGGPLTVKVACGGTPFKEAVVAAESSTAVDLSGCIAGVQIQFVTKVASVIAVPLPGVAVEQKFVSADNLLEVHYDPVTKVWTAFTRPPQVSGFASVQKPSWTSSKPTPLKFGCQTGYPTLAQCFASVDFNKTTGPRCCTDQSNGGCAPKFRYAPTTDKDNINKPLVTCRP